MAVKEASVGQKIKKIDNHWDKIFNAGKNKKVSKNKK